MLVLPIRCAPATAELSHFISLKSAAHACWRDVVALVPSLLVSAPTSPTFHGPLKLLNPVFGPDLAREPQAEVRYDALRFSIE